MKSQAAAKGGKRAGKAQRATQRNQSRRSDDEDDADDEDPEVQKSPAQERRTGRRHTTSPLEISTRGTT
ncbi:hypothetical protein PInf_002550 [Phytophthora infestans]|nr:hypothetical protein PInf_002550 [Phytophthora infestans]